MQTMPVVLNSGLSVKAKAQNICHASKRFRNKKKWLMWGLNPQLHCLSTWFWQECVFPVFYLHQCFQHTVMNEPKQLSISNQHIRVPRFRCVRMCCQNWILKKRVCKSIDIQKNLFTSWIRTRDLIVRWNVSPLLHRCTTQSDHRINSRWQTWK